jgi:predicted ester cyclase
MEGRLRGVRLLDEQREGVDRLAHLVEGHHAALETQPPYPPDGGPLTVLGFALEDEDGPGAPLKHYLRAVVDPRQTVVFRWLAAGDAGDLEAFDELLHPDVVVHAPLGLSTTEVGDEKEVWREALAAVPDLRHDVQEVVVDGDIEMARVVVTGTMAANFAGVEGSGRSFRIDQAVITHLRDGRVIEAWEIADIAALRAQVTD